MPGAESPFACFPFLWLLYVIAFLDRVNVAYAALEMSHDLRFSDRVFGLGAGIFFIGYVLLEIPGALIVERSDGYVPVPSAFQFSYC